MQRRLLIPLHLISTPENQLTIRLKEPGFLFFGADEKLHVLVSSGPGALSVLCRSHYEKRSAVVMRTRRARILPELQGRRHHRQPERKAIGGMVESAVEDG